MKTKLNSLVLALAMSTTLLTGCAWFKAHPQAPGAIAQQVATTVSREVLLAHPEFRPQFIQAQAKLVLLEAQPILTAQDVVNVINLLPTKYLTTPTARISVDAVTFTVQITGNPALPTDTSDKLRVIVNGLRLGVDAGLAQTQ